MNVSERQAADILRRINRIAELARASGRCEDVPWFGVHLEEHDRYAHVEMQAIRKLLGLKPRKRQYRLPD